MSDQHQPKKLTELAFTSVTTCMVDEVEGLDHLPSSEDMELWMLTALSRKFIELKHFFHGTRLPASIANKLTGHLLNELDDMYSFPLFERLYKEVGLTFQNYFESKEDILRQIIEIFLHPDVTEIRLCSYWPNLLGSALDKIPSCNSIGPMILTEAHKLHNLKVLDLRLKCGYLLQKDKLVFPPKLEELTLCEERSIIGEGLRSVVESCPELKCLKLIVNSEEGILHILKCKHLETLHLIGNPEGHVEETCVKFIDGISTDKASNLLCTSTLKSFGITLKEEGTLRLLVNKLPMLTEIILCLIHDFDLFSLTQLKNLRSLTLDILDRTSNEYKKILPILGKNLFYLDLRHYYTLDMEFIGETCNKLKCLCVSAEMEINPKPSLKIYPNFKTVQRLKVNMPYDFNWTEFIIAQCVNLNSLDVTLEYPIRTVIENVLNRTPPDSLKEIHWSPNNETDESFVLGLRSKHPNVRIDTKYRITYESNERVLMYFKE